MTLVGFRFGHERCGLHIISGELHQKRFGINDDSAPCPVRKNSRVDITKEGEMVNSQVCKVCVIYVRGRSTISGAQSRTELSSSTYHLILRMEDKSALVLRMIPS